MDEKSTNKINGYIKNIFFILVSIAFLTAFVSEIETFFKSEIFNWFYGVDSNRWLDFFIVIISLFYLSIKVKECQFEVPNEKLTFLFCIVVGFYTYERFFNSEFPFTHFTWKIFSQIVYLDFLYLFLLLHLANYLKYLVPSSRDLVDNVLLEDLPLNKSDEDELDGIFQITADKIYSIVKNNKFKNSYTIGLNGEWGDGKTSVFNIVKKNLVNEDIIIVDFNPWMGFDKKVLIKDFFNSVSEKLGSDLSLEISKYVDEILNSGEKSGIINFVKSLIKKDESIHSIYNQINKKIELLNKKIVVFIDDVDRLDREEIFELLKLIRNTANFSNVFFIVAYDRTYVNESIKHQSSETTVKYLDKIINVEINLPYFDKFLLKDYFLRKLEELVPKDFTYKIKSFKERYDKDSFILDLGLGFNENDLFVYWLNNFREIKKILNSLVVNYSHIYKEVNFHDVIYLEILKLKHPYLYRLIFVKNKEIFEIHSNVNCYFFAPNDKARAKDKRYKELFERNEQNIGESKEKLVTVFEVYLDEHCKKNNINNIEREQILDLVKRLFPEETSIVGYDVDSKDREGDLSVRYVSKFERYFSQVVFNSNIKEQDFDNFLLLPSLDVIPKIKNWISEDKIKDISWRLNRFDTFENGREYRNVIISSYYLLYLDVSGNLMDFNALMYKFVDHNWDKLFGNIDDAKEFFKDLFTGNDNDSLNKSSTVLYELLRKNKRRTDGKFPLSDDEINEILRKNVQKYLENNISFIGNFWNIYYKSLKSESTGKTPDSVIVNDLKNSLNSVERLEDFVVSLITSYGYEGYRIRHDDILDIFDSYESFEDFIFNDNQNSEVISEFKRFYFEIKDNDWDGINFQFSKVDISHLN